jgi:hypothetical protein
MINKGLNSMQRLRIKMLAASTLLLVLSLFAPISAYAAPIGGDPTPPPPGPPPTTVNVRNSACAGSNITITADPSQTACQDIDQDNGSTATKLAETIVNVLTVLVGVIAVIMIIYAGFRYVSSAGSDDAVKGAKNAITYAIIGIVIVAFAQIIVKFVITKTSQATVPSCVASGSTHKWDSGPNAGHTCTP